MRTDFEVMQYRGQFTHHIDGASVPLISRKSYLSSSWKSVKTRAMVSPGSARILHVQSALFSYSEGKCGLDIVPVVPLNVPPHDPSAGKKLKKKKVKKGQISTTILHF